MLEEKWKKVTEPPQEACLCICITRLPSEDEPLCPSYEIRRFRPKNKHPWSRKVAQVELYLVLPEPPSDCIHREYIGI